MEKSLSKVTISFEIDSKYLSDLELSLGITLQRYCPTSKINMSTRESYKKEFELEKTNLVFFVANYCRNYDSLSKSYAIELTDNNKIFLSEYYEPSTQVYDLDDKKQKTAFKNINKKDQDSRVYYRLYKIVGEENLYTYEIDDSIINEFTLSDAKSVAGKLTTLWTKNDAEEFKILVDDFVEENKRSSKQIESLVNEFFDVFYSKDFNKNRVDLIRVFSEAVSPYCTYEGALLALSSNIPYADSKSIIYDKNNGDKYITEAYDIVLKTLLSIDDKYIDGSRGSIYRVLQSVRYISKSCRVGRMADYVIKEVLENDVDVIKKFKTDEEYQERINMLVGIYGSILSSTAFANRLEGGPYYSFNDTWRTILTCDRQFANGNKHNLLSDVMIESLKTYKRKRNKSHLENYFTLIFDCIKDDRYNHHDNIKINRNIKDKIDMTMEYEDDKNLKKVIVKLSLE